MKDISERLRQADPLANDWPRLEQARGAIRHVVATTPSDRSPRSTRITRRFVLGSLGGVVAAASIGSLLSGLGGRGDLHAAVRFEAHLAETQPVPGLVVARLGRSDRVIYLHPEAIVTNDDIAQSWTVPDGPDRFSVSVELFEAGAQRMQQATAAHIGRPLAIVIDGEVVMAPTVRSAVGRSASITGGFNQSRAEQIAEGIMVH